MSPPSHIVDDRMMTDHAATSRRLDNPDSPLQFPTQARVVLSLVNHPDVVKVPGDKAGLLPHRGVGQRDAHPIVRPAASGFLQEVGTRYVAPLVLGHETTSGQAGEYGCSRVAVHNAARVRVDQPSNTIASDVSIGMAIHYASVIATDKTTEPGGLAVCVGGGMALADRTGIVTDETGAVVQGAA